MKNISFWNQKTISIFTVILFSIVLFFIFGSNKYLNKCIEEESLKEKDRYELLVLGESLAEGSDFLTDEVRKFAITGDIKYLYNYWYEVEISQGRDAVILNMQKYELPSDENALLEDAKNNSDNLINTEICSMKLVLISRHVDILQYQDDHILYKYLTNVMSFPLSDIYLAMDDREMSDTAIKILYDQEYILAKQTIMSPIEKFKQKTNQRLNSQVLTATNGRLKATFIQNICLVLATLLIILLIFSFNLFYMKPLNSYSESFKNVKKGNDVDFAHLSVIPSGAYELHRLGTYFNELTNLFNETFDDSLRAQSEMRYAMEAANQANKAKSEFLAHMSHELRTPLNAIVGYVDLLSDSDLNCTQQKYIENIQLSSENLLSLITNVLDLSKIESGNMIFVKKLFSLRQILEEEYNVFLATAQKKQLNYRIDIDSKLTDNVYGDDIKLRQILNNLLGNAFKFTKNGSVKLGAYLRAETKKHTVVEFVVEDTGIGIVKEDHQKIFDTFVQADGGITRRYGGSGLGLSISKKIVEESSQGMYTIELDSSPMMGSKFYFKMKFKKSEEERILDKNNCSNLELSSDIKILLVDDNEINLDMERELLSHFGVSVSIASSGQEAIDILTNEKFDMVFMDIRMPNMDGYETVKVIRDDLEIYYTPIIALTADVVSGVEDKVINSGMNGYLTKPLRRNELHFLLKKYFFESTKSEVASSKVDKDNKQYIIFEYKECLDVLSNNYELLNTMIKRFIKKQKVNIQSLNNYLEEDDYINARGVLHDILGISGNLYLHKLHCYGKQLQLEMHNKNHDSLEHFLFVWRETELELNEFLGENEGGEGYVSNIIG